MSKTPVIILLLALAGCDSAGEEPTDAVEITLLAVYTTATEQAVADIDGLLENLVAETNDTYKNSRVDVNLHLVGARAIDYEITDRLEDLRRLMDPEDGILDDIHLWRDELEADVVALVSNNPASTINGAILADEHTAFVMVYWQQAGAPDYGLAHEIGHLFGARHSPDSDPTEEPFAYGHGFRNDSLRTIMANGPQQRIPYFSSPNNSYNGVVLGDSALQDVARVLNETAIYLSNFRGEQTATAFVPPGTWPTVTF